MYVLDEHEIVNFFISQPFGLALSQIFLAQCQLGLAEMQNWLAQCKLGYGDMQIMLEQ